MQHPALGEAQEVTHPSRFMEEGSEGWAVNLVLAILVGWARGANQGDPGVICDGEYGPKAVALMKLFQAKNGLDSDGGFGPQTRGFMSREMRFDFEGVLKSMAMIIDTGHPSVFIQPDGQRFVWPPRGWMR